jgi:hypothetical protein
MRFEPDFHWSLAPRSPDTGQSFCSTVTTWPVQRPSATARANYCTIGSNLLSSFMGSFDIAGRGDNQIGPYPLPNLTFPYRTFVVQCKFEGSCQILNSVHRIAHLDRCPGDYGVQHMRD